MNTTPARTYNQWHTARPRDGRRRVSIYWTWSYPWEAQRDPAAMENRFSTITEVRNVVWPAYETPEFSAANFLQGIAGTLELFHRSTLNFQQLAGDLTEHAVAVGCSECHFTGYKGRRAIAQTLACIGPQGINGCGYEAQLESWYRFLIDPSPYESISLDADDKVVLNGIDKVVLEQRKVRSQPRNIGAVVHRDADVGAAERGRVIDAVADEGDARALRGQALQDIRLVLWQQSGMEVIEPERLRHADRAGQAHAAG